MIKQSPSFKIKDRIIGGNESCFIIAEAGINHNGDLGVAKKMVDVAVESGVDAIKFQTFTAKEFISDKKATYKYKSQGKEVEESVFAMFSRNEFTKEQWKELIEYCEAKGIIFFSTPKNIFITPKFLRDLAISVPSLPLIIIG